MLKALKLILMIIKQKIRFIQLYAVKTEKKS